MLSLLINNKGDNEWRLIKIESMWEFHRRHVSNGLKAKNMAAHGFKILAKQEGWVKHIYKNS